MPTSLGNPLDLSMPIAETTNQAYKNWQQQQEQLQLAKDQFAKNQGTSDAVVAGDRATQQQMNDAATQDRALYTGSYVPAMQQQLDFARNYTTPERMAANRGAAMATSNIAFDANADAAKRTLQSNDIDPSAGRFVGLDAGLAAARAKAAAGAGTQSDRTTEQLGQQYLEQAIQTGAVLPGQAVNEAGLGVGAGNAAVNTGLATTASGFATEGTPLQWNQQGNQMFANWPTWASAETNAGMTQNRDTASENLAQEKLNQSSSSGIGALLGAGAGLLGGVGKLAGGLGGLSGISDFFSSGSPTGSSGDSTGNSGTLSTSLDNPAATSAAGTYGGVQAARGGMIPKMASGGTAHDLLGTAGSIGGNMIFPVIGGMVGKFVGNALGDLIEGNPGNIGGDAERDATFGAADPDKPGGVGMPNLPGVGGLGKALGIGGGGAGSAGSQATDAASWGGDAAGAASGGADIADAGMLFAQGGEAGPSNMVQPDQSPSRGAQTDDVHAMLNEGEFVVPKDVASWLGEKFLQNLINKARTEASGPKAEPEMAPMPQAMALAPPSFRSEGARAGA